MDDLLIGIPTHFRVQDELGRGVTSSVFRARDSAAGRWVALKVMHPTGSASLLEQQHQRVEREFRAAGRLHDIDGVIRVFNVGTTNTNAAWIAMELADGSSLSDRFTNQAGATTQDCVVVLKRLLNVLQRVHDRDVIHGDISPANILFVTKDVRSVALSDFGLCRIDNDDQRHGFTPAYGAPELFDGHPPTPSTDRYGAAASIREWFNALTPTAGFINEDNGSLSRLVEVLNGLTLANTADRMSGREAVEMLRNDN